MDGGRRQYYPREELTVTHTHAGGADRLSHHRRRLRADLGSQAHTAQDHLVIFPTCYS